MSSLTAHGVRPDVFARLLTASVPGATGAALFAAAVRAYADAGFPGEERAHHQGGGDRLPRARMGRPSVLGRGHQRAAGARVEPDDHRQQRSKRPASCSADGAVEVLTTTPDWPSLEVEVRSQQLRVPAVLVLDA